MCVVRCHCLGVLPRLQALGRAAGFYLVATGLLTACHAPSALAPPGSPERSPPSEVPSVSSSISDAGWPLSSRELPSRDSPFTLERTSLQAEIDDWSGESASPPQPPLLPSAAPAVTRVSVDAVQAPLNALLVALARDAGVELSLLDAPDERVSLSLHDRPFEEALDRLAAQVPFHWERDAGQIVVRGDSPYSKSHAVDYLNLDRTTRGSVGLATRVGSIDAGTVGASGASNGGGIANSSETLIENSSEHRFWDSLGRDVVELFAPESDARWSINRDVGLITLFARPASHQRLSRFLDSLHASAQRQVLIEATVVEVALSDSFEAGIDWQVLARGVTGLSAAQVLGGQPSVNRDTVGRLSAPTGLVSLVQASGDGELDATLSLLERFGDVRILSRPRIIALNNQSSVLKVVDNRVYFTARVERRITEDRDEIVTDTEIHTVPVGLVMNVTPFIGAGGAIMLNVRPTLSRILGFVDDPNPELALANVRNGVPEIQVREMESMLRVQSGDVAIIGGLMQESLRDDERRLPGLADLPIVGRLFERNRRERSRTELLIVLRPTVMPAMPRLAAGIGGGAG